MKKVYKILIGVGVALSFIFLGVFFGLYVYGIIKDNFLKFYQKELLFYSMIFITLSTVFSLLSLDDRRKKGIIIASLVLNVISSLFLGATLLSATGLILKVYYIYNNKEDTLVKENTVNNNYIVNEYSNPNYYNYNNTPYINNAPAYDNNIPYINNVSVNDIDRTNEEKRNLREKYRQINYKDYTKKYIVFYILSIFFSILYISLLIILMIQFYKWSVRVNRNAELGIIVLGFFEFLIFVFLFLLCCLNVTGIVFSILAICKPKRFILKINMIFGIVTLTIFNNVASKIVLGEAANAVNKM